MGKVFKVTYKLYNDEAHTDLYASFSNIFIGIAVGSTSQQSSTSGSTAPLNYLTSKLADVEEASCLGYTYLYNSPNSFSDSHSPSLYMALCIPKLDDNFNQNKCPEIVFANGYYMRPIIVTPGQNQTIDSNYRWGFYDDNGTLLGQESTGYRTYSPYFTLQSLNSMPHAASFVFSAMNADGTIPADASAATYRVTFPTGSTKQRCWIQQLTSVAGMITFFNAIPGYTINTDPYAEAGNSEPGGGDGDFDFSSTDIPIPSNPSIGAMQTGFISLYAPSAGQLKSLANYMWAGAFDVTQFKKLFSDPMDAILGLHIIPTISGHPATGSGSLLVGNIDTGLTMPTVTEQYYSADFGTVNIPAKWGAYLDYSPYTKLSLYLPYIGFVPISPDDCMRGSINVVYHVDILSGTCVAFVYCYSNRGADGHTLYIFNGSCSCDCPVTSGQYRSALEGLLGVAGSIGRVAAGDVGGGLKDAISNVTAMLKPEIGRSGSFGGAGGLMGIQYPYLVLTVPRMCIPGEQNTFIGYPSFVTKTIGDLEGYTSIDVSHLNNMPCTESETAEIISLLGEGIIL